MNQSIRYATASETGLDGNTIIYQNYLYIKSFSRLYQNFYICILLTFVIITV